MSHSFKVCLPESDTKTDTRLSIEVPDDDWDTLLKFVGYADQLLNALPPQLNSRITLSGSKGASVKYEGDLPSNESISAVLHRLRPFVLQKNEPTYFPRVVNILSRYLARPKLREMLQSQKDFFEGIDFQRQLKIEISTLNLQEVLNSEESFKLWLNAFEYHRDTEKQKKLEKMCGCLPFEAVRALFISMLTDKARAVLNLMVIIRRCEAANEIPLTCNGVTFRVDPISSGGESMGSGENDLTKESLSQALSEGVPTSNGHRCDDFFVPFGKRADELEAKGQRGLAIAFRFLCKICTMRLKPDDPQQPFAPYIISGQRSLVIDELTDPQIEVANAVAREVADAELRARLADIVWIRDSDFWPLVSYNPLVPIGREPFFIRGLHAGLRGDFLEALHILIPQLENSLRHLLNERGVVTSSIDADGIQKEHDLNVILYAPELNKILEEDIIFDLRCLLVERASPNPNFRNRLAHGMIEYGVFFGENAVYIWWLILHLCFLGNTSMRQAESP